METEKKANTLLSTIDWCWPWVREGKIFSRQHHRQRKGRRKDRVTLFQAESDWSLRLHVPGRIRLSGKEWPKRISVNRESESISSFIKIIFRGKKGNSSLFAREEDRTLWNFRVAGNGTNPQQQLLLRLHYLRSRVCGQDKLNDEGKSCDLA